MQCSCGGSTEDEHKVIRGKEVVTKYLKCEGCGRIVITWKKQPPKGVAGDL